MGVVFEIFKGLPLQASVLDQNARGSSLSKVDRVRSVREEYFCDNSRMLSAGLQAYFRAFGFVIFGNIF